MAGVTEIVGNGWTLSQIWCAGITSVILIWVLQVQMRSRFRGATVWPILGVLPSLLSNLGNLHDWLTHLLIVNGGTARFPGPWKCRIMTADPANIEYLLKTRFHNFGKGEIYRDTFHDMFGESVLLKDGDSFKRLIVPIVKAFSTPAFSDSVAAAMPAVMQKNLLPVFTHACEKAAIIDLQEVFHRFACYNVWLFGAGVDLDCLKPGPPKVPFLEAFLEATQLVMIRWLMPPFCWKILRRLHVFYERRFLKARDFVYDFVIQHSNSRSSNAPRADIMFALDRFLGESGQVCSDKVKSDLLVNLVFGGTDTITMGLAWFFWLLAKNPRVEVDILAELRGIVKQRKSPEDQDEDEDPFSFSFEEVKRMDYLHAAVTESLRLYPPLPFEYVVSKEEDVLPDGTPVEKGAQIFYSIYSSRRLENVWGKDCLEFKPERWMKNGRFVRESEFKFVVFNGGARRCTGMDFAYWQMKWAAASILIRYSVKIVDKHPVLPKYGIVLSVKHGLLVRVQQREKEDGSYHSIPPEHL